MSNGCDRRGEVETENQKENEAVGASKSYCGEGHNEEPNCRGLLARGSRDETH